MISYGNNLILNNLKQQVVDYSVDKATTQLSSNSMVKAGQVNNQCNDKFLYGISPKVNTNITGTDYQNALTRRSFFLCHTGYAVQFDPLSKNPLWVAEKLTKEEQIKKTGARTDDFRANPTIPSQAQATLNDYRGSGFDRGHMAPAADMKYGDDSISESFFLTNMVPQVGPNMNRGIWADLENQVRQSTIKNGTTYVITGPLFLDNNNQNILIQNRDATKETYKIGKSQVFVPTHLYKLIYNPATEDIKAYILPNFQIVTRKTKNVDKGNPNYPQTTAELAVNCGSYCTLDNFLFTKEQLEQLTGFVFFPKNQ